MAGNTVSHIQTSGYRVKNSSKYDKGGLITGVCSHDVMHPYFDAESKWDYLLISILHFYFSQFNLKTTKIQNEYSTANLPALCRWGGGTVCGNPDRGHTDYGSC